MKKILYLCLFFVVILIGYIFYKLSSTNVKDIKYDYKIYKDGNIIINNVTGFKIENGYLFGIEEGRTSSDFDLGIDLSYTTLILNKDNLEKTNGIIFTGDKIQIKQDDNVIGEYIVCIKGDIDGDGEITPIDYVKIKNHIMREKLIKGDEYLNAADMSGDGIISPLDYVKVKNYIMNRSNDKYTITYNANGGLGSINSQGVTKDTTTNVRRNSFANDGYIFNGWNTKADGSGQSYYEVEKITATGNIVLYAQWIFNSIDKIHVINVGSADAILLESNGHYGLIDAAIPVYNDGTVQAYEENKTDIVNYMVRAGVTRLDFVIATHSHADHIGGMVYVANSGLVTEDTIYYYRSYEDTTNDYTNNGFAKHDEKYYVDENYNSESDYDNWGYYCRSIVAMGKKILNRDYECDTKTINVKVSDVDTTINKVVGMISEPAKSSFTKGSGNGGMYELTNEEIEISLGNFRLKILNTTPVNNDETELSLLGEGKDIAKGENKNSIIQLITHIPSNTKTLLAADIGYEDEARLLQDNKISSVDILKTGHHGCFSSGSLEFVKKLSPAVTISSNGGTKVGSTTNMVSLCYAESKFNSKSYATGQVGNNNAIVVKYNESDYVVSDYYGESIVSMKICPSSMQPGWVYSEETKEWYYFDKDNVALTYWQYLSKNGEESWFYFDDIGRMLKGWQYLQYNGTIAWYYFDDEGRMLTGWQHLYDNGKLSWYYFSDGGRMLTGWQYLEDNGVQSWYNFGDNGRMLTGWQYLYDHDRQTWHYFDNSGKMVHDECRTIDDKEYCFNNYGECYEGNGC